MCTASVLVTCIFIFGTPGRSAGRVGVVAFAQVGIALRVPSFLRVIPVALVPLLLIKHCSDITVPLLISLVHNVYSMCYLSSVCCFQCYHSLWVMFPLCVLFLHVMVCDLHNVCWLVV